MSMDDDVLAPFEDDWRQRAQAIRDAIERLGASHEAPRIETYQDRAGRERFTLVRRDGDVARLQDGRGARASTTRFTPEEWAMIERVVLLRHGLAPATLNTKEQSP